MSALLLTGAVGAVMVIVQTWRLRSAKRERDLQRARADNLAKECDRLAGDLRASEAARQDADARHSEALSDDDGRLGALAELIRANPPSTPEGRKAILDALAAKGDGK